MKFKSTLLFIKTFCIALGTQAQFYYSREYNYYYTLDRYDYLGYSPTEKERKLVYSERAENNVKSSEKVKVNHKQDTLFITNTSYNKKGRIVAAEKVDKKGKKYKFTASYSNDSLLSRYETKHNKKHKEVTFEYNEEGKLTHLLDLKNGEKLYEIKKVYKGKRVLESVSIDYSNRKPRSYKTINTINEEGKVIKTAYYKNDKLKRTWEYDCSEKGVEAKPKKSEEAVPSSSSCSWKAESSDGSYTFYHRTLNGKKIHLYESHYDKDSVLVNTKTYDEKDRLKYEVTYFKNHKVDLWYKSNGKVRRYYTEVSDPKVGVMATSSIYYGLVKTHNSVQKTHNEAGLLVELVGYSNGKRSKTDMTYSYFSE